MNINSQQIDISVVIPVYGCDESLSELHRRLVKVLSNIIESLIPSPIH